MRTRPYGRSAFASGYRSAPKKRSYPKREAKRVRKPEEKFVQNYAANGATVYTAPFFLLTNGLAAGATRITRTGNQTSTKHVFCQWALQANNTAGRARCMMVLDTEPNGVAFNSADLFSDPAAANNHISPYNLNYVGPSKRFRILMDRLVMCNMLGGANDQPERIYVKKKIPMRGIVTQYNDGVTATIADISKNAIWAFATTDFNAGGAGLIIGCDVQYVFTDD